MPVPLVRALSAPLQERASVAVALPSLQLARPVLPADFPFADRLFSTSSLRLLFWPWRCPPLKAALTLKAELESVNL